MTDQYFARDPSAASRPVECAFAYRGHSLRFLTDAGVFSKGELDTGTRLLLDALPEALSGETLDMGCGWGAIGVSVAAACPSCRVTMADVNRRALELAGDNCARNGVQAVCVESDGFAALRGRSFQTVITNPPIRAGKRVIYAMLEDAAASLTSDGALYLVIRKQQGGESAMRFLGGLFDDVQKIARSGGFWVIRCQRPRTVQTDETSAESTECLQQDATADLP